MSTEDPLKFPQELEEKIEEYALGYLRQGRAEWDEPHTRAVVFYAEKIARASGLDVLVIKTAAWLHDIGYHALFQDTDSKNYGNIIDKKEAHMVNGERLAKEFLERPGVKDFFSDAQRERIVHLVSVHDKIDELKDRDEIVLMEADTLGAIDISRVAPTFDIETAIKYTNNDLLKRRFPKFQTSTGVTLLYDLFPKFLAHFDQN
jgi:putative nucleotidyltransferase with HDIG domain